MKSQTIFTKEFCDSFKAAEQYDFRRDGFIVLHSQDYMKFYRSHRFTRAHAYGEPVYFRASMGGKSETTNKIIL